MRRLRPARSVKTTVITLPSSRPIVVQRSSSPVPPLRTSPSGSKMRVASSKRIPCFLTMVRFLSSCHSNFVPGFGTLQGLVPTPVDVSFIGQSYTRLLVESEAIHPPSPRGSRAHCPSVWRSDHGRLSSARMSHEFGHIASCGLIGDTPVWCQSAAVTDRRNTAPAPARGYGWSRGRHHRRVHGAGRAMSKINTHLLVRAQPSRCARSETSENLEGLADEPLRRAVAPRARCCPVKGPRHATAPQTPSSASASLAQPHSLGPFRMPSSARSAGSPGASWT